MMITIGEFIQQLENANTESAQIQDGQSTIPVDTVIDLIDYFEGLINDDIIAATDTLVEEGLMMVSELTKMITLRQQRRVIMANAMTRAENVRVAVVIVNHMMNTAQAN